MGLSHFLSDFLYLFLTVVLEYRSSKQIVVDARADAEEHDACGADGEGNTGVDIGLERRQRRVTRLDVHGLDNEQIVVK